MAINLDDRYPGRAGPKNLAYPQGSFKNRTSPTSKDGTYLEKDWANDWAGFFQALLSDAGMTANGVVDTAQASQYFDALIQTIKSQDASETSKGVLEIATAAEAQALTDDARALTPKKLADAFKGGNQSLTGSGYQRLPGGLIFQWGLVSVNADQTVPITFPIAFATSARGVIAQTSRSSSGTQYASYADVHLVTTTGFSVKNETLSGAAENNSSIYWFAFGH